jgi:signal recognition particle subunit SRP72
MVAYTVPPGELETYVPTVPSGWAPRGTAPIAAAAPAAASSSKPKATKPRHRLPKGAVAGQPFKEDVSSWKKHDN